MYGAGPAYRPTGDAKPAIKAVRNVGERVMFKNPGTSF
jgi:hypothetical protein